jgi:hypothetical protein
MKHSAWIHWVVTAAVLGFQAGCVEPTGTGSGEAPSLGEAAQPLAGGGVPVCVTIQRGMAGAVSDAFLADGGTGDDGPDRNYGDSLQLLAGAVKGTTRQSLLRFDLAPVPAGVVVTAATVTLVQAAGNPAPVTVRVHDVLAPWAEGIVTWNGFGGGFDPAVVTSFPSRTSPGAVSFDVTGLVKSWLNGSLANDGVLLERTGPSSTSFYSSEYATVASRPRLAVCYLPPGPCANQPNGTACDDGNACTVGDTCQGGSCAGGNPVVCAAPDQCHAAGVCNPGTGVCSTPVKANGAACNDGNACTQSDTCQAGACTGSNPVVCAAPDQCHLAGACDPASGACSFPARADGTVCNDGSACTQGDVCQGGFCLAMSNTCQLCEGSPFLAFPFPDWLVDNNTLTTDGPHLFLASAVSAKIHTIDPVGFSVTSAFHPDPPVGNLTQAVNPSTGQFFYGTSNSLPSTRWRLSATGAVELGPVVIPGIVGGSVWDDQAKELHSVRGTGSGASGDVLVMNENLGITEVYGDAQLASPQAISINAAQNRVAVTDLPGRVHLFNRTTRAWIQSLDGAGSGKVLSTPAGVAQSNAGLLWVVDRDNNRVVALDLQGSWIQTLTGFNSPRAILFHEATGCLFVTEYNDSLPGTGPGKLHRFCPCP